MADRYGATPEFCDPKNVGLGFAGVTLGMVLSCVGSTYASVCAGNSLSLNAFRHRHILIKGLIPVIMASVLGIYGLVYGVIVSQNIMPVESYSRAAAYAHFNGGLICGLSCVAAGYAVGAVGRSGTMAVAKQPRLFVTNVLILVFIEALALFGLIVSLRMALTEVTDACQTWPRR